MCVQMCIYGRAREYGTRGGGGARQRAAAARRAAAAARARSGGRRPFIRGAGLPALEQCRPQQVGETQRGERAVEVDDSRGRAWPARSKQSKLSKRGVVSRARHTARDAGPLTTQAQRYGLLRTYLRAAMCSRKAALRAR